MKMTDGERLVWATAYAIDYAEFGSASKAAYAARQAFMALDLAREALRKDVQNCFYPTKNTPVLDTLSAAVGHDGIMPDD